MLVVGCGNVGSRHLQSLVRLPFPLNITVIEPNLNSQRIAKSRLDKSNSADKKISWFRSMLESEKVFDLVIVATSAGDRKNILDRLLEHGNKRFLIEKMVCQSKQDYEELMNKVKAKDAVGWVNTNRRCFPFYRKIKDNIDPDEKLQISIIAGNGGLGSNAIHFVDLFLWFTNSSTISLNGKFLTDKLYPSKRKNEYLEFSGTIIGRNSDSILTISFLPVDNLPFVVEIVTEKIHIIIDETNEKVIRVRDSVGIDRSFKYLHVSDLTQDIVSDILKNDTCCLPRIEDLFYAHSELFRIFNWHIKKLTHKEPSLCPIT